ncbi:CCAAT/enhancer-binding protein delta [Lutra lutra]|uniref:CCAAT/enhancer-binding protein delta n=1 Tax=Lutra lutra TaxID=9657 RepID=UPI001FD34CAA|nr:CCAAT/enhancer-binding protein delta [Lutra lutra]
MRVSSARKGGGALPREVTVALRVGTRLDAAMSAALFSLDGPARGAPWPAEPAPFYEQGRAGKPGRGSESGTLSEPGAVAPAMYDDESAIDFSAYIDSMAAVPTLELCHDELFADLFNSNHKTGAAGAAVGALELLPGGLARTHGPSTAAPRPLKREPDWGDGDAPGSLLPAQVAACAQTVVSLAAAAQPTPPTSPEPPRCSPGPSPAPGPAREKSAGKRGPDRGSPEYRQRRERNNIAVRKSRDKAKRRNQEMQQKLVELSAENEKLHQRVEQLTRDLAGLRQFFKQLPSPPFLPAAGAADCR